MRVTIQEAIKQLKDEKPISRATLDRWIKAGKISSYHRVGDPHTWVDLEQIREIQGWQRGGRQAKRRQPRPAQGSASPSEEAEH